MGPSLLVQCEKAPLGVTLKGAFGDLVCFVFDRMIVGWLCLSIVVQEVVQIGHAFTEHFDARQIYHAEMVGAVAS